MVIVGRLIEQLAHIAFTDAILLMLAAWYIGEVLTVKAGPFSIFFKMRNSLPHGGLLHCLYCIAVWITPLLLIAYVYMPCLIWPFALAGGALMLRSYSGVRHDG